MPIASNTSSRSPISIAPAAARCGSTAPRSISATCAIRAAPASRTWPTRRSRRLLARIDIPEGWHSHKVRAANGIMIVNHEQLGKAGRRISAAGSAIYDVSKPAAPKLITKWMTAGKGVHRYDFDGRYAYISPTAEGYIGNITMILDLADPAKPKEVGRWWIPGQWQAGGEAYPWGDGVAPRCHHPLRVGDRLYVSYWHHGLYILDISDMAKPKAIAQLNTQPGVSASDPYLPAHSAEAEGPRHHGGGRRGRGEAHPPRPRSPGSTTSPTRRSRSRSRPSRCRASTRTARRSRR